MAGAHRQRVRRRRSLTVLSYNIFKQWGYFSRATARSVHTRVLRPGPTLRGCQVEAGRAPKGFHGSEGRSELHLVARDRKASEGRSAAGLTVPVSATELPRARRSRPPQTPWEGGKGVGLVQRGSASTVEKRAPCDEDIPLISPPVREKASLRGESSPSAEGHPVRDVSPDAGATITVSQAQSLLVEGSLRPRGSQLMAPFRLHGVFP